MSALADLRSAVAFLTPFGQTGPPPSPLTMTYFPLVGAAIGGLIGLTWRRAGRSFPRLLAAALAVSADCVLTGALHLDGLADTADGLLAHVPSKGRLDIMAEPAIGTFGAVALGVALATRLSALAALEPSPVLLGALYCSSRSVMVIGSRSLPYARSEGLVSAFLPATETLVPGEGLPPAEGLPPTGRPGPTDQALVAAYAGGAAALVLASVAAGRRGAAAVVTGWGAAAVVLESARRRLGGYTGDVLGAAGVACETAGLVVAARGRRG